MQVQVQVQVQVVRGRWCVACGMWQVACMHIHAKVGDEATLAVDYARRAPIAKNHTCTHMLNLAIKGALGVACDQRGSLCDVDKLRFDIAYGTSPYAPTPSCTLHPVCTALHTLTHPHTSSHALTRPHEPPYTLTPARQASH